MQHNSILKHHNDDTYLGHKNTGLRHQTATFRHNR